MRAAYRQRDWMDPDPEPAVPTADDIRLADEIRYRLELRLLPPVERPAPPRFQDWAGRDAAWFAT